MAMENSKAKYFWFPVLVFGIVIGLYPILFLLVDMKANGLLSSKGDLVNNTAYMATFYAHIYGGGLALLVGWPQFKRSWRQKYVSTHRLLGKIYLLAILVFGAPAGLIIAFFATGSIPSQFGFSILAVLWWYSSWKAWKQVRIGNFEGHREWMIRSYALSFAAVTLRIYLPVFTGVLGWEFEPSYQAISWLCWVPNIIFAEWLINKDWVRV
jgi:uncharacterized membrane protein